MKRKRRQELEHTEEISVHLLPGVEVLEMLRSEGMAQALHSAALWRYFAERP